MTEHAEHQTSPEVHRWEGGCVVIDEFPCLFVSVLQEYSEWKKEAADISLPGVYIGLMDRLHSFSRVIVNSTQEMCSTLESSYLEKVKETCKNGEEDGRGRKEVTDVYMSAVRWACSYTPRMFCCVSRSVATSMPKHATCGLPGSPVCPAETG